LLNIILTNREGTKILKLILASTATVRLYELIKDYLLINISLKNFARTKIHLKNAIIHEARVECVMDDLQFSLFYSCIR